MISILMATYNGESYIRQQLDSILNQTVSDFVIHICDDCSSDATFEVARQYESRFGNKIIAEQNEKNSGNAKYNFMKMMLEHKSDYVMLCDQDDVWMPDKIEKTLEKMRKLEEMHGVDTPILIHTDLQVTDRNLNVISPSFERYINIDCQRASLNNLLLQNIVTGCTAMYNRSLADLMNIMPPNLVMHDWWLALTASALGVIGYIPQPLILYRQHGSNEIGAKNVRSLKFIFDKLMKDSDIKNVIFRTYSQAQDLLDVYVDRLSGEQRALLAGYCEIPKLGKFGKWIRVSKLKVSKNGFARNIAYLLYI